ncbi:MAG: polyprenyl synthetase family protein [Mesonia hippocampi]|uniref:polyprenyl synthetase family protein n=1 Tax=Mesonia hippocampi TaxID=1628250 RepID=UPI003F97800C
MEDISFYREEFLAYLSAKSIVEQPGNLYDPINYILQMGGKRLRPVLTLVGAEAFGVSYKEALDAALAVEFFHNFSLMHDDIMDDAPLRRGKITVHEKWNLNTAILSGDAMLIRAYQFFENYKGETFRALAKLFSKTAVTVCEGQQYDIDFETQEEVSISQYINMIRSKTAVLIGAALEMGAIVAGASVEDKQKIFDFGCYLGIAFQLQDDFLDVFGDPKVFGKQVGGDIIENKKTFLYLNALKQAEKDEAAQLKHLYSLTSSDSEQKIDSVKQIFIKSGAAERTEEEIKSYIDKALAKLDEITLAPDRKILLRSFGEILMARNV